MDNKTKFKQIFKEKIHRKGADEFIQWLESTDFFTAPASTKYHGAFEGGLCAHSLNVYELFREELMWKGERFSGQTALDEETEEMAAICGLLHDICKVNKYVTKYRNQKNEQTGQWEKVPYYSVGENKFPYGHGESSVWLIQRFIRLNVEESLSIRWHMGGFDDAAKGYDLSAAYNQYPNAMMLHIADMKATYLLDS